MRRRTKGQAPDRRAETGPPASTDNDVESPNDGARVELTPQQIREDIVPVFELLLRWDQERRRGQ